MFLYLIVEWYLFQRIPITIKECFHYSIKIILEPNNELYGKKIVMAELILLNV